jgi:ParB/RepB/Spo0J family partition protein
MHDSATDNASEHDIMQAPIHSKHESQSQRLSRDDNCSAVRTELPLDAIDLPEDPMRTPADHDEESVAEMAASMTLVGLINEIVVKESSVPGRYLLICGMRRYCAAQKLGMERIPARVYPQSTPRVKVIQTMWEENEVRSPVDQVTKARWLKEFMTREGMSGNQVAKHLGIRQSLVSDLLQVLDGPPDVLKKVESGEWSFTRALAEIRERRSAPVESEVLPRRKLGALARSRRRAQTLSSSARPAGTGAADELFRIVGRSKMPVKGANHVVAVVVPADQPSDPLDPAAVAEAIRAFGDLLMRESLENKNSAAGGPARPARHEPPSSDRTSPGDDSAAAGPNGELT